MANVEHRVHKNEQYDIADTLEQLTTTKRNKSLKDQRAKTL
jgi:hypothetical protein